MRRTQLAVARLAVGMVVGAFTLTGVASAEPGGQGKSVSDFVRWTKSEVEAVGCEYGRAVSNAASDNRQDSGWRRPGTCTK